MDVERMDALIAAAAQEGRLAALRDTLDWEENHMGYKDRIDIKTLIGERLTHIDTDEKHNVILLTTASGRTVKIYHAQDCCEHVYIVGTEGDWHKLIGKVIVEATHDETRGGEPRSTEEESWTNTALTFRVDDATVISRWLGESNGYYSESVDLEDIYPLEL
jgi:hypothetical protein